RRRQPGTPRSRPQRSSLESGAEVSSWQSRPAFTREAAACPPHRLSGPALKLSMVDMARSASLLLSRFFVVKLRLVGPALALVAAKSRVWCRGNGRTASIGRNRRLAGDPLAEKRVDGLHDGIGRLGAPRVRRQELEVLAARHIAELDQDRRHVGRL